MMAPHEAPQATPPIPKGHPLRDLHEARRQALLVELHALNRALGIEDGGNARQRRERARRNEEPVPYLTALDDTPRTV